ncbi:MAG: M14 family metallopeptidase, partial [Wenzhouxiangellaceae bacterium]
MQVAILDHLPDRLLRHPARKLAQHLDGPTLIHLPGRKPDPLFVSVIQHGNEPSGWDAIRRLLTGRYKRDPLPRSLALFVGNVDAAAANRRHLPEQSDMNRGWPGTRQLDNQWRPMLAEISRHMQALKPYASIDIHNNTGENPHYAAINRISARFLNLASRFSRTVVYFTEPTGVQSAAFSEFCPSVTLECGPPGKRDGTDHAMAFVETILAGDDLSDQWPHPEDFDLCQVTSVVKVPPELDFRFGGGDSPPVDLLFDPRLDRLNFIELPPGTALAQAESSRARLSVCDTDGRDISAEWTELRDGRLRLTRPAMPAMLTTRAEAIRQDCLC